MGSSYRSHDADHCQEHIAQVRGWAGRPEGSNALEAWLYEVRQARWFTSSDIKRSYASASIVSSDRAVFNIKGNAYRLVVSIDYKKSIVWIIWLGDHEAYDRIDVTEVTYDPQAHQD